jgi:hypothetical protein
MFDKDHFALVAQTQDCYGADGKHTRSFVTGIVSRVDLLRFITTEGKSRRSCLSASLTRDSGSSLSHLGYLLESKTKQGVPERMLGSIDSTGPACSPSPACRSCCPRLRGHPRHCSHRDRPAPRPTLARRRRGHAPRRCAPRRGGRGDEGSRSIDAGGYETHESFESVMDETEQEPRHFAQTGPVPQAALQHGRVVDDRYPVPDNTMVVPAARPARTPSRVSPNGSTQGSLPRCAGPRTTRTALKSPAASRA